MLRRVEKEEVVNNWEPNKMRTANFNVNQVHPSQQGVNPQQNIPVMPTVEPRVRQMENYETETVFQISGKEFEELFVRTLQDGPVRHGGAGWTEFKHAKDLFDLLSERMARKEYKEPVCEEILFVEEGSISESDLEFLKSYGNRIIEYKKGMRPPV